MTKIRLLFFAFLLSLSAYSQFPNPGVEGFENTTGPDLASGPSTWTLGTGVPGNQWAVFDNGVGSTARWGINSTVTTPPIVCNGLNIAYMNRVNTGGAGLTSEHYLATPRVTVPVNGQLRFVARTFTAGNTGTFYDVKWAPSTANQMNPADYTVTLATYTEDQLTQDSYSGVFNNFNICTTKIIDFPATLPAGTQGYIAFVRRNTQVGTGIDGDRWLLDDVQLNSRCLNPTNLGQSGLFFDSADLTWGNPSGATSWEVEVLPAATAVTGFGVLYSGTLPYHATTTSYGSPLTQTPLLSNTPYKFYVRAVCPGSIPSAWVGPFNFTTTTAPPVCGGNFVDPGGPTANYPNSSDVTTTICPTIAGQQVTVTFTAFDTEATWDGLYVFDGNNISAPQIASANPAGNVPGGLAGSYWGTAIPGPFTGSSANGCLTFRFRSDASFNNPGWIANVTCAPPPTCPRPTALTAITTTSSTINLGWTSTGPATTWEYIALPCNAPPPTAATVGLPAPTNPFLITGLTSATCYNIYVRGDCSSTSNGLSLWSNALVVTTPVAPPVCGGNFVDPGGPTANYPNSSDVTTTICPTIAGQQVTVTFTAFNTEATWDGLYVFDGNTTAAPMIASANPAGNVPGGVPGSYWGTAIPGPFTGSSANGCLTFRFRSDASVNNPGWLANITCAPAPTCPKPTAVVVSAIGQNTATIGWTEIGSATTWHVLVLPASAPAPNASTPGWQVATTNPYIYTPLSSGTQYKVYVRSFCSDTDISLWSNGTLFATLISNDECITAVQVPVNPDANCTQVVGGTLIGATASTQPNTCGGTDDDDVWFSFVATSTSHIISLINVTGSTTDLFHVLYTGNCTTGLTQIYCSDPNQSTANNLVVGQTYYIRVYSWTATPNQTSTFNVCVGTLPPPITTSTTLYTIPQLVEDVLFNSTCATITNITSSTGTNFGSTNGISYFNQNGSSFPFAEGILLSTGDTALAPGPNTTDMSSGVDAWPGDTQLFNYIQGLGIDPGLTDYNNATKLEFDFVPLINTISFDFIFASEEYGTFQCAYSDAFAFFLTNNTTGVTTNLAVLPSTTIPISVVTIRNALYNAGCASANPTYFNHYYDDFPVVDVNPLAAPHNFNGDTVTLTATSAVVPGTQYHIKLVIADRNDTAFDSGVFLKGGSFNIGNVELGTDFLEATGTALCDGASYTIQSGLNPAQYSFTWTFNGNLIPNQTSPNLVVTQEGIYGINATFINTTCVATDSITIEFYDPVSSGTPNNLTLCNGTGFGQFTLNQNDASALGGLSPAAYSVAYYLNVSDAEDELNALPNLYTNVIQYLQTIYVRVENNTTHCFTIKPFNLIVQDLTPLFTITPNFSICTGASQTITVTPTNFNLADVTFTWTLNGNPFPGNTNQITVTTGGTYEVTVNNNGCTNTGQTTVTLIPFPVPDDPANVTSCNSYTLPALTNGNYYTLTGGPTGGGTLLLAGAVITSSQTLFVYSSNGYCTAENSFDITITPYTTATFTPIGSICQGLPAPSLPLSSTNATPITGTWNPAVISTVAVGTTTYTFTPDAGQCAVGTTMDVTISNPSTVPTFTTIAPICVGGIAPVLPTTSNNNITGTWNPATVDTSVVGSVVYTFTPDAGQCAVATQITVVILAPSTPTFATIPNICQGNNAPALPTTSTNNIVGVWSPSVISTATPGTSTYTFTPNGGQCAGPINIQVTIHPTPVLAPVSEVDACDSYTLPALSVGNYYAAAGGVSPITNLTLTSSQLVYVYAQSGTTPNCTDQDSFMVNITPSPQFTIEGGCDGAIYVLEVTNANFNTSTADYSWTGPNGPVGTNSPILQVSEVGTYTVIITVDNGTKGGCSTSHAFNANDISCIVPKGISPNGDGLNDNFDLTGYNVGKLSIFNRLGTAVYTRNDYKDEWYGQSKSGNELPDGTYYYVIERKDGGDTKTGWVFINREN